MDRDDRFSPEELEKARALNYDLVTDMAAKLDNLKGYDAAFMNPRKGKMIVNFNGQNYIVDVEPINTRGNGSLQNAMKEYNFIFND